ncbi:MAG: hypothetical protein ACJAU8_000153 [Candidatus Paceibacteria bacterium]|jgi:hypothetical protein
MKKVDIINPLAWKFAFPGITSLLIGIAFFILWAVLYLIILLLGSDWLFDFKIQNGTALVTALVALGVSIGIFSKKAKTELKELTVNTVGVIKLFGSARLLKGIVTDHGNFKEMPKIVDIDPITLSVPPRMYEVSNITTSDGLPMKIGFAVQEDVVNPYTNHAIQYGALGGTDVFIQEKMSGMFRDVVNTLGIDDIDITQDIDALKYHLNILMLRNELFYLKQPTFNEVHYPADTEEHKKLHKAKARFLEKKEKEKAELEKNVKSSGKKVVEETENLGKHFDIENNLIFYYPNMGSNISVTIQTSVSTDNVTLEARAEPIRRTAKMAAALIEATEKARIQGILFDQLRKVYDPEKVDDQMILRVSLLITDEYENEQLIDFSGIDSDLSKLAVLALPFLKKLMGEKEN